LLAVLIVSVLASAATGCSSSPPLSGHGQAAASAARAVPRLSALALSRMAVAKEAPSLPDPVVDRLALGRPSPYMGVACHVFNSVACDRVRLQAVLPARWELHVRASIGGRAVRMHLFEADESGWNVWEGQLRNAGLQRPPFDIDPEVPGFWSGRHAPLIEVRIVANSLAGRRGVARVRTQLNGHYGCNGDWPSAHVTQALGISRPS
jgi:hypothetical protein